MNEEETDVAKLIAAHGRVSSIQEIARKGLTVVRKQPSLKEGNCFKYSPALF